MKSNSSGKQKKDIDKGVEATFCLKPYGNRQRSLKMIYYYVRIPGLPKELSHQRGMVELIENTVKENENVRKGKSLAIVENWWAKMELKAVDTGVVSKVFFEKGTQIREGDPFAIIVCDPENAPKSEKTCEFEVIEQIRKKPGT